MGENHRGAPPPDWLRAEARRLYGTDPVAYEAGRPDYPQRVYEVLRDRCGLAPGQRVLEIGPGTGRMTRHLLEFGASVVAVEPDTMLATYVSEQFRGRDVEVHTCSFEDYAAAPDSFDLVVSAMSFHWVDQDIGLPKLGRIVRPGGWVALWWTVFGDPTRPDPFHERTAAMLGERVGEARGIQFELDADQRLFDLERKAGLVDVESEMIRWTARMNPAQVRGLYASMIKILRRPEAEQKQLLDALLAIANEEFDGVVVRPFVTALYTARRKRDSAAER